jgi:5'-nucleotidase
LRGLLGLGVLGAGCSSTRSGNAPADAGSAAIDVQILALSTWLGQLDPLEDTASDGGTASFGGLGVLSAYFHADRAANPNTILVLCADSFGASPPLSGLFQDEPAVLGLNFLGASADMLGNHNFNFGDPYLDHLIDLSAYPYVATNLQNVQAELQGRSQVPYALVTVAGVKIALLGISSPTDPTKTFPGRFGAITIQEPVGAAIQAAAAARAAGAAAVVVLTDLESTGVSASGAHTGPLDDFATSMQGADLVLGYRASDPNIQAMGGTVVVENRWKGRTYVRAHVKREGGAVTVSAEIVEPDGAFVTPDPAAETLLAPYRTRLAAAYDQPVATASGVLSRDGTERSQEVPLGDLIADAFLAQYQPAGAQLAVMNSGGIRDSLPSAFAPSSSTLRRPAAGYAAGPPYDVVTGDAYTVLPFGDHCVLRPVTGATVWAMLENSVFLAPTAATRFLQIAGFRFVYKLSAPPGARVQSVTLTGGTPIPNDASQTYALALPDIIDDGTDGFTMLVETVPSSPRDVEADVLLKYVQQQGTLPGTTDGRIQAVP